MITQHKVSFLPDDLKKHCLLYGLLVPSNGPSDSITAISQRVLTDYILEHMDRQMITGAVFIDLKKAFDLVDHVCLLFKQAKLKSGQVVWTGLIILPHELKECNLEMTCLQHEPSILASLRVQFWGLYVLFYTLMTCPSI